MIKFSVYVDSDTFDKLLLEARKDGRPLSNWVAHKLETYVNRFNPSPAEVTTDGR